MSTLFSRLGTKARVFAVTVFWTASITIFVNDNLFEINGVRGPSMNPTLSPEWHETRRKDYVLCTKQSPTRNLRRGDVVSFWNPSEPRSLNIKRVVGLEGDFVTLDARRRPKNNKHGGGVDSGESWDMLSEVNGGVSERTGKRVVKVPFGHVWVEGDNWRESVDSNSVGPVCLKEEIQWPRGPDSFCVAGIEELDRRKSSPCYVAPLQVLEQAVGEV